MTFSRLPPTVVVDASAMVRFLVGDSDWVRRWTEWADEHAVLFAPPHFHAEVANALLRSMRLPAADVSVELERLSRSGVEVVGGRLSGMIEAVGLADQHGLTVYDALYLQLALDVGGELATLDADLRRAAESEQIEVIA